LDLAAIRNYIQYAYENWDKPPTYVTLWGTGNYDYRKIEGYANYVPAYQKGYNDTTQTTPIVSLCTRSPGWSSCFISLI
jgi:hypothetical protein